MEDPAEYQPVVNTTEEQEKPPDISQNVTDYVHEGSPDIRVMDIGVDRHRVATGDPVKVSVTLVNYGDSEGVNGLSVLVSGFEEYSTDVSLDSGESRTEEFSVILPKWKLEEAIDWGEKVGKEIGKFTIPTEKKKNFSLDFACGISYYEGNYTGPWTLWFHAFSCLEQAETFEGGKIFYWDGAIHEVAKHTSTKLM